MKPASRHAKIKGPAASPHGSEPKLSLTERVYAALKKDIITGVLRPGQAFTEKDLAHRYAASRTPVREAAVRLQEEDLVRIIPNHGYFVTQLTIQGMNDMYEFRAAIECACVELVCGAKISHQVRGELELAAQFRAHNEEEFGDFVESDTAFHIGIARWTHNALLVRAVAQMRAQTDRILFAAAEAIQLRYYGELPAREHMVILGAISRNDPELARRLMREHIIGGKNKILDLARRDMRFP